MWCSVWRTVGVDSGLWTVDCGLWTVDGGGGGGGGVRCVVVVFDW